MATIIDDKKSFSQSGMSPIYGQLLSIKQRVKIRGTGRRDNNEGQQKKTLFGSVQKGSCDACDRAKLILCKVQGKCTIYQPFRF